MFKSITRANRNTHNNNLKKYKNNYPQKKLYISPYTINCSVKDWTKKEDKHLKDK